MKIKAGDKVIVRNWRDVYARYEDFMEKYKTSNTKPWKYGDSIEDNIIGVVESINRHESASNKIAIVNTNEYSFMIGLDGLEKTFEEGDRVRCLSNNYLSLNRGEIVTVNKVFFDKFQCEEVIGIDYNVKDFELVKEECVHHPLCICGSISNELLSNIDKLYKPKKTNRIRRIDGGGRESLIEYDIVDNELKFKVYGQPININTVFKILLNATKLYKDTYRRVSPYKVERVYDKVIQGHIFTIKFFDIKADFNPIKRTLLTTNRSMQLCGEFSMFKYDFTEICVERGMLERDGDGYKLIKDINEVMNYCDYLPCKPSIGELKEQGYIIPQGYKLI